MKRNETVEPLEREMILAGFTYFLQFIDHDLTFDTMPLARAHPYAERLPNLRTPFLNLDQLYGGGPTCSPFLYRNQRSPGNERFLIGRTVKPDGSPGEEEDLPRNSEGIALVGDPRQDENLIIAQLHVTFLKCHNAIMDRLKDIPSAGPAKATPFEQARRLLTWYYQQGAVGIVRELVDEEMFEATYARLFARRYEISDFRIPIEFSVAAFRFGHSIVRDGYDYNRAHKNEKRATLEQLLRQTGMGGGTKPSLPDDWVIELDRFFDFQSPALNNARKFSTKIAGALYQLHPGTVRLFNAPPVSAQQPSEKPPCELPVENAEFILPIRTLWRGARMGLPSGQEVAQTLCLPTMLGNAEIAEGLIAAGMDSEALGRNRLHEDTPLWYYILKEAESVSLGKGRRLGPVGGWIVAETILGALRADPNSYLSINPAWKPPPGLLPYHLNILRRLFR